MGTNYYAVPAPGVKIHLGKQSAGWPFLFRAYDWPDAEAWEQWFATASSYRLVNEYGDEIDLSQLVLLAVTSTVLHHEREHLGAFRPDPQSMLQFDRRNFC